MATELTAFLDEPPQTDPKPRNGARGRPEKLLLRRCRSGCPRWRTPAGRSPPARTGQGRHRRRPPLPEPQQDPPDRSTRGDRPDRRVGLHAQRPRDYDPQPIPGRTSSEVLSVSTVEDRSPAAAIVAVRTKNATGVGVLDRTPTGFARLRGYIGSRTSVRRSARPAEPAADRESFVATQPARATKTLLSTRIMPQLRATGTGPFRRNQGSGESDPYRVRLRQAKAKRADTTAPSTTGRAPLWQL